MWGFMAAGMGLNMFGGIMQGQAQRRTASYNARLLQQRAAQVEAVSEVEQTEMRKQKRRTAGAQRAAYGKSGAMITSGTPLLVMAEQASEMERDILEQKRNRLIEAQGLRHQAAMTHYQGRMASRASMFGASGTLLGGLSQMQGMGGGSTPKASAPNANLQWYNTPTQMSNQSLYYR